MITGPVTQPQLKIIKDDLQNVQNLITEDVFQMIDNLSQALTEKEGEVMDIKKTLEEQKTENQEILESNKRLEQQVVQTT